jgi:seryl-tRNA synthetase
MARRAKNTASLSSAEAGGILRQRSEKVSLQLEIANLRERREFYSGIVAVAKAKGEDYLDLCSEVDEINGELQGLNARLRRIS